MAKLLPARRSIVLKLHRLIGNIACCCRDGRGIVTDGGFFCSYRCYCEKTDKEVVVAE
jgi:hypothetical protein